jgi:hypothetical protein
VARAPTSADGWDAEGQGMPPNNRLKLTRGEGASHASGAHARASRARGVVSRRAQR